MTTATAPSTRRVAALQREYTTTMATLKDTAARAEVATGAEYNRLSDRCNRLEMQAIRCTKQIKKAEAVAA